MRCHPEQASVAFAEAVKELPGSPVEIAKRNELHAFKWIPKGWVVER